MAKSGKNVIDHSSRIHLRLDSKRGFLTNYPPDVVYVINGHPVTRSDILQNKQKRQERLLAWKRRSQEDVIKPALIKVFYVPCFPFGPAWWTYIRTSNQEWGKYLDKKFILQAMSVYPCGYLVMAENYTLWATAFAEAYHRPTNNPTARYGRAACHVRIDASGTLREVRA